MAQDNFDAYDDGNLDSVSGGVWAHCGWDLEVVDGQVCATSEIWWQGTKYAGTFSGAQYAQCVLVNEDAGEAEGSGPSVLMSGTDATSVWYQAAGLVYWNSVRIYKVYNGQADQLSQTSHTLAAGDTLRIEVEDGEICVYHNTTADLIDCESDASYTSGNPGLAARYQEDQTPWMDNWEGGDLAAGGATIPVFMRTYQNMRT